MSTVTEQISVLLRPLGSGATPYRLRWSVDEASAAPVTAPLSSLLIDPYVASGGDPDDSPEPPAQDLSAALKIFDYPADQLVTLLVDVCTQVLHHPSLMYGPWDPETARPVLAEVVRILGPRARWWCNALLDPPSELPGGGRTGSYAFYPVTNWSADRVLIGAGAEAIVTFLTFVDD